MFQTFQGKKVVGFRLLGALSVYRVLDVLQQHFNQYYLVI